MSAAGSSFFFIFVLLAGKSFFALLESALRSLRKTWLRTKAEDGDKKYRALLELAENPAAALFSLRLSGVFLSICAGLVGGLSVVPFLNERCALNTGLSALLTAVIIVVVSGFLSGVLTHRFLPLPEQFVAGTLPLIKALVMVNKPLVAANGFLSGVIFHIVKADTQGALPHGITEAELRLALQEGEKSGVMERTERTMVEGVFYLGDRPAGTFMTHRSEVAWLDSSASVAGVKEIVADSRKQRYFPVADGTLDEVIGVVSVEDILLVLASGKPLELKTLLNLPCFVPETMSALKVFEVFKQSSVDFLLVMDEYGGFAGVLSLNNLVEEIVGQLSAHTQNAEAIVRQSDGTYLVDGSVNIDEIVELLSLPGLIDEHQEYHTLAGFVLRLAGEIPRTGQNFDYKGFRFRVLDMDGNRIDKVQILRPTAPLSPYHAPTE